MDESLIKKTGVRKARITRYKIVVPQPEPIPEATQIPQSTPNPFEIFTSEEFGKVRVVMRDGDPWFVAADVCRALELEQVTNAIRRLDDDEKALI